MKNPQHTSQELPQGVIDALSQKRVIHAIKLLREEKNMDLKEAKEQVARYLQENPKLYRREKTPKVESSTGRFLLLLALLALIACAYFLFVLN